MVSSISSSVSSWTSALFSQLDTSNKGYISQSDLSTAFSTLNSTGSDSSSSASKLFSSMDSDNDGKITKDELASTLQSLADQLNSQYDASRMASAMGQGMPPPPPPADSAESDSGLTKDQMTSIASTTDDSKLANLLNNVASNFSAADTDGDGKVTRKEAMAYQESTQNSAGTQSTASASSQTTESSSEKMVAKRILELLQAYSGSLGTSTSTSSVSLSA